MPKPVRAKKLTPILFVPEVEPCVPFWTERLGYKVIAEVKDEGKLAFVLLANGEVHIMYQTRKSLAKDMHQLSESDGHTSACLYIDVESLDAVEKALAGVPIVIPRRTTFYGATEVAEREPSGNLVVFAEHAD